MEDHHKKDFLNDAIIYVNFYYKENDFYFPDAHTYQNVFTFKDITDDGRMFIIKS